jgi:hypothetical protein
MDAQMMIKNAAVFTAEKTGFDGRKAAIMRDAALPDAPFVMPRQVIEVSRPSVADTLLDWVRGFGLMARGR